MSVYSDYLRNELTKLAKRYSKKHSFKIMTNYKSAVIFNNIKNNFHSKSYKEITSNTTWKKRLQKKHQQVKGAYEMQSSNSSDALLMNIFCHPDIKKWRSVAKLFDVPVIKDIKFGYNPTPPLEVGGKPEPRPTEIDLLLNDSIICEAKLTEGDFQEADIKKVGAYQEFEQVFDYSSLRKNDKKYYNYQLIRNILVAHKEDKRFILICDMRRPDLVKEFYNTVICIKDIGLRKRCQVIYWQDIAHKTGNNLSKFLNKKYGIN